MSKTAPPAHPAFVDLSADPFLPEGWSIKNHLRGEKIDWRLEKSRLHIEPCQRGGHSVHGDVLCIRIRPLLPYNANLLDFLLKEKNHHLIPREWPGKTILFWGTVYLDCEKRPRVRYLYWARGVPKAGSLVFIRGFDQHDYAVVPCDVGS
jgi:hypothetical protein